MKEFKFKAMALKAMSEVRGGTDITYDTTILLSRKTKQVVTSEDDQIEIVGTITIDKER